MKCGQRPHVKHGAPFRSRVLQRSQSIMPHNTCRHFRIIHVLIVLSLDLAVGRVIGLRCRISLSTRQGDGAPLAIAQARACRRDAALDGRASSRWPGRAPLGASASSGQPAFPWLAFWLLQCGSALARPAIRCQVENPASRARDLRCTVNNRNSGIGLFARAGFFFFRNSGSNR